MKRYSLAMTNFLIALVVFFSQLSETVYGYDNKLKTLEFNRIQNEWVVDQINTYEYKKKFDSLPILFRFLDSNKCSIRKIASGTIPLLKNKDKYLHIAYKTGSLEVKQRVEVIWNKQYKYWFCNGSGICYPCKGYFTTKKINEWAEDWGIPPLFSEACPCNYRNDCIQCEGAGDIRYKIEYDGNGNNFILKTINFGE